MPALLENSGLGEIAARQETVLIKPNLVETLAPPITTPASLVEEIIDYLLDFLPAKRIIIGEGCGARDYDTHHAFAELGYADLGKRKHVQLIDLNTEKLRRRQHPDCSRWPEMYLPEILDRVFLLSVPQLKAHSLSGVTLTMKNMMGCAPPSHYCGGGAWNKASFHDNIHHAIFDLNRYRTPDFTLVDATIGMARAHLWGPHCEPPVDRLACSFDPVAIDSYGATLLKRNWRDINHIVMADGVLGQAEAAVGAI
ncbi:MAG: DUF362 domain-containing protein [Desulfopila sp.]